MKYLSILLASLLLSFNAFADYAENESHSYPDCESSDNYITIDPKRVVKQNYMKEPQVYEYPSQMGPYKIEIYLDAECHEHIVHMHSAYAVFNDAGKEVYSHPYGSLWLQETTPSEDFPFFVLQDFSGGAHCCYDSFFFSKNKPYRLQEEVYSRDVQPHYEDIDNDGDLEMFLYDANFAYWRTSFAYSRFIKVIYRVDEDGLHIARDLIQQEMEYPTVESALKQIRRELENVIVDPELEKEWGFNQRLHDIGVFTSEFLYAGMTDEALEFYDQIWSEQAVFLDIDKSTFWKELIDQIIHSRHFLLLSDIEPLNPKDHEEAWVMGIIMENMKRSSDIYD